MHSTGVPIDVDMMEGLTLFNGLGRERVEALADGGWTVEHARSVRVIGRGDHIDGLYGVFDGRLKLYMLSCNGDERVLRVLRPGDTFGEAIMFNAIPSPVYVETLSPARLGYFPRELINEALASDPEFTNSMLRGMSVMMRELIQDLETCCMQTAMQRTVSYLLREASAAPSPNLEVNLPAPKAVVASTLNISAETFSRELHRLQGEGFIEINRRTIYLRDPEALQTMVDGLSPETSH
ncbi:Crp/Fnr family transcriptional regulator [Thiosocius teredinicola]|uniref:Crp/Fnr family transcriptional regulator n=1 Tax=Thiosocius teredinicola TaxID=1973002 RepID=UPI0009912FBD